MTQPPPPPPGYPPQQPAGQAPNNYLVWSILVTLFCCLPFGIVAIVKSSQVNGLWAQGRYAEAQASADSAKKWVMWSVIVGLIVIVINVILAATGAYNGDNTNAAMLAAMF
ncbi:CD225/dispanin family protein [Mycobacterium sp. 050134]|uniref:CD225/dispanin family protein n=1 Tax=Mycobacterium sp. 050134 TaxID=3096111 RepID=UPI002ED8E246